MRSIVSKNIYALEKMGYEVEEIPELYEVTIMLRSEGKFGFALYFDYDDLQSENAILYIVRRFNSMITHKLDIVE